VLFLSSTSGKLRQATQIVITVWVKVLNLTYQTFTTSESPSRGPSVATADVNKNLDDIMIVRIPAPWDAEALEQFHDLTHH
jgi:hypothetical protein